MNKFEISAGVLTLIGGPLAFSELAVPLQMLGGGLVAIAFVLLVMADRKGRRDQQ